MLHQSIRQYHHNDIDYKSDKFFGPILSRLDAYFYYLKVDNEKCRQRLICEVAKEKSKYSPISDLVLKAFR